MADKTPLDQIRPAKGVKLQKKPKEKTIVQDVKSDVPLESLPPPTEDATKMVLKLNASKENLMDSIRSFNKLLSNKTLPENKSAAEKEVEQKVITQLTKAAIDIEEFSPGEGLFALCILALRQSLSLRDAGNALAYKVKQLEERLPKTEEESSEKKVLEEMAKKMGLKIKFEDN